MVGSFLALAAVSLLALIVAVPWTLATSGRPSVRDQKQGGAARTRGRTGARRPQDTSLKARSERLSGQSGVSVIAAKDLIREGEWQRAVPLLVGIAGMHGFLLFGALAFYFAIQNPLIGGAVVAFAVYSLARTVVRFVRA